MPALDTELSALRRAIVGHGGSRPAVQAEWLLLAREEMVFFGTNNLVETELLSKAFWIAHPEAARDKLRKISDNHENALATLAAQHLKFLDYGCNQKSTAMPLDWILVLGHDLATNGTPSSKLLVRLNATLECLKSHPSAHILVSGGLPKAGATQARVMSDWLVSMGVPQVSITLEDASADAVDNIVMSTKILQTLNTRAIKLITCNDHMTRVLALLSIHVSTNNFSMELVDHKSADDFANTTVEEQFLLMKDIGRLTNFWSYRF